MLTTPRTNSTFNPSALFFLEYRPNLFFFLYIAFPPFFPLFPILTLYQSLPTLGPIVNMLTTPRTNSTFNPSALFLLEYRPNRLFFTLCRFHYFFSLFLNFNKQVLTSYPWTNCKHVDNTSDQFYFQSIGPIFPGIPTKSFFFFIYRFPSVFSPFPNFNTLPISSYPWTNCKHVDNTSDQFYFQSIGPIFAGIPTKSSFFYVMPLSLLFFPFSEF